MTITELHEKLPIGTETWNSKGKITVSNLNWIKQITANSPDEAFEKIQSMDLLHKVEKEWEFIK